MWAKHFQNGTIKVCWRYSRILCIFIILWQKCLTFREFIYCYYHCFYHWRRHRSIPLALSIGLPHFVYRKLNNSTIWLLPSRCLTSLKHGYKLKTWMQSFSGWFAWFWSPCIPYSIWIFAQPFEDSFFLRSEEVHIDSHAEEREDHEYYNEIPGKQPPAGGVSDMRIKVQATEQMAYCPIRCEKLCYLVCNVLFLLDPAVQFCPYH